MTTNNNGDATEKVGFIAKLKSIKHIEIIAAVVLCVICVAAYFMFFASDKDTKVTSSDGSDLCNELADIVSQIEGVGKCKILITYDGSEQVEIAFDQETVTNVTTDSDSNSDRVTENTTTTSRPVIITVDGKEQPLIINKKPAKINGIVVVAEGGDDVYVKINIIDAICALTNVNGNCVKVYKMK